MYAGLHQVFYEDTKVYVWQICLHKHNFHSAYANINTSFVCVDSSTQIFCNMPQVKEY